ncbi:MAG: AMP-dependent synthetase/ligase [Microbacteriaceae bacterium]
MLETSNPLIVPHDPNRTVSDFLEERFTSDPDHVIFSLPRTDGGWEPVTTAEFRNQVVALAKGFMSAGIRPGDKVGFICATKYEWSLVDFAMFYAGGILVPIYETSSPSQIAFILADSGAVGLIVDTAEQFSRFDEVRAETPGVGVVWQLHHGDIDKLVAQGADISDEDVTERRNVAVGADVATLIYTSGTTGNPKGCVLTHANFVDTIASATIWMEEVVLTPGASTLLFITTAHVFARVVSILCVHAGVRIGHQPDTKFLLPALASFKPTFLLAVPRVFEKVYNSAEQKAEAGGKGKIFRLAAHTAIAYSKALDAGKVPLGLKVQFAALDKLVLSKLRSAMGGNVVYAISGSAPLGPRLGHFYRALGIRVLEGYGLTETTAPVSINVPHKFKIGTVGPVIPGASAKIADDGEILAKGVNVFAGYWHNDKATAEAFVDGWYRTGDIGTIDEDGYLTITGRKKELIVTAGGKNVAPAVLEDPIRANPLVGQCVVVGDNRPYVAALISLDSEMLPTWLANNKLDPNMTLEQAGAHPAVLAELQVAVDRANKKVSRAESVRKFIVLPLEFTEASGHLTPKMSIKRHVILKDFAAEIDGIYDSNPDTKGLSLKD